MICPRCRCDADKLFKVTAEGKQITALCRDCMRELGEFLTSLPSDGEQHWDRLGAIDGSEMIERFEMKEGLE